MLPRYSIPIAFLFLLLALARGHVFQFQSAQNLFSVLHAHADGGGGDGGGGAGAGTGGDGSGSAGAGDGGGGAGIGASAASGDGGGGAGTAAAAQGDGGGGAGTGIGVAAAGDGGGGAGIGTAATGPGPSSAGSSSGGGEAAPTEAVAVAPPAAAAPPAALPVAPPAPASSGGGGGGGGAGAGGGSNLPNVVVSALPHAANQPLAFLYLSQIPYTGLDLGPAGTIVYWVALVGWALALAYLVLFGVAPFINRHLRRFAAHVSAALTVMPASVPPLPEINMVPTVAPAAAAAILNATQFREEELPEISRGYSPYDGFRSFAREGTLSIDDIVKGLTREDPAMQISRDADPASPLGPERESVGSKAESRAPAEPARVSGGRDALASVRGFAIALIEGDRNAVFSGLRQHLRGAGTPEKLLTATACLLDDAYRARIDGTSSDPDIARLVDRFPTPTLENLISALTTAIDSSYTSGVTGAKLALIRALAVIEKS